MTSRLNKQLKIAPYIYISPYFILFFVFSLYPILYSIYISFTDWNGSGEKTMVGFENYIRLFGDKNFWLSLWNSSMIFLMYVPLMLFLGLIFASMLNSNWMVGKGFFRMALFVPNFVSVVAVSFVFVLLLNTQNGLFNSVLRNIGLIDNPIPWLESPWWARISVAIMVLYRWLGYNMLLLMTGLQNISKDLYEAAYVDGATKIKSFFFITIPLVKKMLLFCTVLSTIGTFSLFTEPFILTQGGPLNSTLTPVLMLYTESFQNFNFGYASSIAVCFFILMMTISLIQMRVFDDKE
ncbi:lactose/L-arabinose transport system permease protein [Fontibacillus solani]|uniref:Carbohydrate ABC transporter membrane protein 1, CUT1 family n=2 Tax=Fontibacillus TaxID=995014 RepID=A0A1G7HCV0_9BACL|nr:MULTISPECIES: sugar ABC transporter permease [Fontibacillus]MBA9084886.1 lactose/L-arabinose transport system permease protein [Fontibacillus solani]SDE98133.1 carbohydrate ABC transporter membrane protein 1, CUT1 family [Fontibacillus panacisegetis]